MTTPETCDECKQISEDRSCGCNTDVTTNVLTTKLCPLHRSAERLLEACKDLTGWFVGNEIKLSGNYPVLNEFIVKCEKIIKKAESN